MNTKKKLTLTTLNNVYLLKNFIAIFPLRAFNLSLFDNLPNKHRIDLIKFSFLSFIKNLLKTKRRNNENYALIFNVWSSGYHHFITETLLKAVLFKEDLKSKVIIIPPNSPNFIKESLNKIHKFEYIELNTPFFLKKLTFIDNPNSGYYDYENLFALKSFFVNPKSKETNTKIYLSRKNARSRKILNENELVIFLKKSGFKIVETDDMKFDEQITLFSEANFLISPHGAGLTNMIFMKEASSIIELIPEESPNDLYEYNLCYERMSCTLKYNYRNLPCKREDVTVPFDMCNLIIDIDKLELIISQNAN
jgi:hypothetical protein